MEILPIGKGRKVNDGKDLAIISIGTIGNNVQKAIQELNEMGISVAHYDMIFLKPIDSDLLNEITNNFDKVITIEDGTINGGLSSAVMEWCADNNRNISISRLGIPDNFIHHASVNEQYELCGIDIKGIKNKVIELLNDK